MSRLYPTGKDLLSLVPNKSRALRCARFSSVVDGAVAVARTHYENAHGDIELEENLNLPFEGESEDGARQILIHTNVRPDIASFGTRARPWHAGLPAKFIAYAFR